MNLKEKKNWEIKNNKQIEKKMLLKCKNMFVDDCFDFNLCWEIHRNKSSGKVQEKWLSNEMRVKLSKLNGCKIHW